MDQERAFFFLRLIQATPAMQQAPRAMNEDNKNSPVETEEARRKSKLDEMKSVLEERVKSQPANAGAWRELAQVKMMLGDIDGAENDCIECLRIDQENAPGLVLMGNLRTNFRKDDASAERYYSHAAKADPKSATAHANYGTLLLKKGEKYRAIQELRKSVQLDSRQCVFC
jgi:Tfp pilus assembly protein PilF